MIGAFIKAKFRHRYTRAVEHHGMTEAESGLQHLEAKEPHGLLAVTRSG